MAAFAFLLSFLAIITYTYTFNIVTIGTAIADFRSFFAYFTTFAISYRLFTFPTTCT
jgi:hypothetical protein